MTHIAVIGIDPGAKHTGIVLRQHRDVLHHVTIANPAYPAITQDYLDRVLNAVQTAKVAATAATFPRSTPLIAVEGVEAPNPHLGMINTLGVLGIAQVLGAIRGRFRVVVVDPGKNGKLPLQTYPPALIGPRETGVYGQGKLRHERSAWDVAGKAHLYQGIEQ